MTNWGGDVKVRIGRGQPQTKPNELPSTKYCEAPGHCTTATKKGDRAGGQNDILAENAFTTLSTSLRQAASRNRDQLPPLDECKASHHEASDAAGRDRLRSCQ